MLELKGFRLDQDIQTVSAWKQDMSNLLGFGQFAKMFPDEKLFKTNQVDFLNVAWDCMLGVTNNLIYKIALSGNASNIFERAYNYFFKLYGHPTVSKRSLYIWETSTANLTLSKHWLFRVVNIIATSGIPFHS